MLKLLQSFQNKNLTTNQRMFLIAIHSYNGSMSLSYSDIRVLTGLSFTTIKSVQTSLLELGYISIKKGNGIKRETNTYSLVPELESDAIPELESKPVTKVSVFGVDASKPPTRAVRSFDKKRLSELTKQQRKYFPKHVKEISNLHPHMTKDEVMITAFDDLFGGRMDFMIR